MLLADPSGHGCLMRAPSTPASVPSATAGERLAGRLRRIAVTWTLIAAAVYMVDLFQQTRVGLTNGGGRPVGDDFINYLAAARPTPLRPAHEVYQDPALHALQP